MNKKFSEKELQRAVQSIYEWIKEQIKNNQVEEVFDRSVNCYYYISQKDASLVGFWCLYYKNDIPIEVVYENSTCKIRASSGKKEYVLELPDEDAHSLFEWAESDYEEFF